MNKQIQNTVIATVLAFIAVCIPVSSRADTILGVYLSASKWSPDFSGNISNDGPPIDLQNQLNIDNDDSTIFSIALEHPIPGLPNIKLQRTDLTTSSSALLDTDISFGGVTFPSGSQLSSLVDLGHTDYIFYYEILDNWVSLDLGITVMNFDGNINLQTTGLSSAVVLDDYVPAGYGKVSFELPFTGAYVGTEGSVLSVGDNSISDYKVHIGWESDFGLGVELGYHNFAAEWVDFDNSEGDLTFDGYYASVIFHF